MSKLIGHEYIKMSTFLLVLLPEKASLGLTVKLPIETDDCTCSDVYCILNQDTSGENVVLEEFFGSYNPL